MEDWKYYGTYSGRPQGGIISPLMANIVLNEMDVFIEDELIPKYSRGKGRIRNPEYKRMANTAQKERKKGNIKRANELRRKYTKLSSVVPDDPNYRR